MWMKEDQISSLCEASHPRGIVAAGRIFLNVRLRLLFTDLLKLCLLYATKNIL